MVLLYFSEINSEIKQQFPNAQFVVIDYGCDKEDKEFLQKLKNQNIIVISLEELTNVQVYASPDYTISDGWHPNEAAWKLLTPLIVKKLSL